MDSARVCVIAFGVKGASTAFKMVQLKSFKYIESNQDEQNSVPSQPAQAASTHSASAPRNEDQALAPDKRASRSIASASWPSSGSSPTPSASTIIGGNLTSDSGSEVSSGSDARPAAGGEAQAALSSGEEYQSARVDLEEEEEDEQEQEEQDEATSVETEIAKPPDGDESSAGSSAARRSERGRDSNITKIQIEHSTASGSEQRPPEQGPARGKQEVILSQRAARTPLMARPKMYMPRSQTSPSHLNQMALGKSANLARGLGQAPSGGALASPLIGCVRRTPAPGDSASFTSAGTQQRSNQFEIRWHKVKLYTRPKSRLPRLLTDSLLYRGLFGAPSEADDEWSFEQTCYSPPVQHKIPPTIDEGLEMSQPAPGLTNEARRRRRPDLAKSATLQQSAESASSSGAAPKTRCILNNVSGQVFSGQMTAILGPSGVGKTSLLNSLTGRNTLDGTGRVSLIGANESKRMSVVTVPQVDVLPGKLTTLEDLQFTSRLKNPQARFDHRRNIDRIVKCLHMDKFLHTRIDKLSGGEARRLSIGRELLNSPDIMILDEPTSGLDANTCKKIIIALRDIVEHCDNILDKPMSIIITIHQPQQEVYNLFHRVYVMAVGGRVIFEGAPQMLLPTIIEQSSLSRACPMDQLNENPAIVAIEVASGEYGPQIIHELAAYHENQVYEEFVLNHAGTSSGPAGGIGSAESPTLNTPGSPRQAHRSPLSATHLDMASHRKRLGSFDAGSSGRATPVLAKRQFAFNQLDRMSSATSRSYASISDADLPEPVSKLKVDKRLRRSVVMKSNFMSHTVTLIRRCWLLTKRNLFLMSIRIIGFLLVAGGTVQIFSHALDPDEHQCPQFESEVDDMHSYIGQVKTRLASLLDILRQANSTHLFFFHLLLCLTMVTSALAGLVFPLQMRMFIREYKNGWYSPASFIMSQTIAELPADIIGPIVTLLITYPLCHQPDSVYSWRELGYAIVLIFCCIICKSQAQIVGAFLMDSVENSVFISCVCVTGPALLSGIPLRINQMIGPMQWLSYGSFLRYSFESLMALRYGYGMCPCDPELVDGYPLTASARAIPPHLENLAAGLLNINQPGALVANETAAGETTAMTVASTNANLIGEHENLFLRFIRLVTDASNMFVGDQIGDCKDYRSLYLIGMNIPNDILNNWIPVMLLMFVVSRILTYFAVKTVIKLRRS